MPKMQVYLPDELYDRIKARSPRVNVSGILQHALTERLAQLEREDALAAAVDAYEAELGAFSDEELERQADADRVGATQPPARRRRSSAA